MDGIEEQTSQQRPNSDLEADVEDLIIAANANDSIHGIMVYYPIFGGRQDTYLQQIVDPRKDVEGLHFSYCFNMYHNIRWINPSQLGGAPGTTIEASSGSADREESIPPGYAKSILPCTPLAVVKCLESLGAYDKSLPYGDRLFAREQNASHRLRPSHIVRTCDLNLQECIAASDVVISGVPAASFKIQTEWVKPGTVTVNFSSEKNFEKDVRTRAAIHLPAIGSAPPPPPNGRSQGGKDEQNESSERHQFSTSKPNGNGNNSAPSGDGQKSHGSSAPKDSQGDVEMDEDGVQRSDQLKQQGAEARPSGQILPPPPPGSLHQQGNSSHHPSMPPGLGSTNALHIQRERASTLSMLRPDRVQGSPNGPLRPLPPHGSQSNPNAWEWRSPSTRSDSIGGPIGSAQSPPFGAMRAAHSSASEQSRYCLLPLAINKVNLDHNSIIRKETGSQCNTDQAFDRVPSPHLVQKHPFRLDHRWIIGSNGSSQASNRNVPSVLGRPNRSESMGYPHGHHPRHSHGNHPGFAHGPQGAMTPTDDKVALEMEGRPHPMQVYGSPYVGQMNQHAQLTSQQPPAHMQGRPMMIMPQDRIAHSRRRRRPPFSYSSLIAQAIASAPEGRMTLREIYTWISNAYPDLYSMEGSEGSGWQNTVRHNLSLNKAFIKVARTAQDIYDSCSSGLPNLSQQARGKGGWWMLDPNVNPATIGATGKEEEEFLGGPDTIRTQRRRRTNSFAASVASEDGMGSSGDLLSPMGAYPQVQLHSHSQGMSGAPSVLQMRGRAYTTTTMPNEEMEGGNAPSVLARPRSADRPISHEGPHGQSNSFAPIASGVVGHIGDHDVARHLIGRTRPRGYTTNSADVNLKGGYPMHINTQHNVPVHQNVSVPNSPYGHGPQQLPRSPAMQGNQQLLPPPPGPHSNSRMGASPSMHAVRSLGPAPNSTHYQQVEKQPMTPGQAVSPNLYPVNSPNKRKLRFDGEPGLPIPGQGVPPPAFYPSRNGQGESAGHASPHQRLSMPAPSPLGGQKMSLAPPPITQKSKLGDLMRRQSSTDEGTPISSDQGREHASATVEREGKGSRMSITGLLS
ncbi:hypothetical protein L7F22_039017 [Adiantum nelumboides]|nr:hypothetical protein [Adiantum nelumboides]